MAGFNRTKAIDYTMQWGPKVYEHLRYHADRIQQPIASLITFAVVKELAVLDELELLTAKVKAARRGGIPIGEVPTVRADGAPSQAPRFSVPSIPNPFEMFQQMIGSNGPRPAFGPPAAIPAPVPQEPKDPPRILPRKFADAIPRYTKWITEAADPKERDARIASVRETLKHREAKPDEIETIMEHVIDLEHIQRATPPPAK